MANVPGNEWRKVHYLSGEKSPRRVAKVPEACGLRVANVLKCGWRNGAGGEYSSSQSMHAPLALHLILLAQMFKENLRFLI